MSSFQVIKVTRNCDGCGQPMVYFRLRHEKGRSPSYHNRECSLMAPKKNQRTMELVDFMDIPPAWQKKLEQKAAVYGIPTGD